MNAIKLMKLAVQYYQAGNLQQSIYLCKKILKTNPKNITALHLLGVTYQQLHDYDAAIQHLTIALKFDSNSYEGFYNLGSAFEKKGELDKAVDCYEKVIALHPGFIDGYIRLANVLKSQGKTDRAISYYQQLINLSPNNAGLYFNLGNLFQYGNHLDEAISSYQTALKLNFQNAGIYNNLGLAFQKKGLLDEALINYQEAIKFNSSCAEAYYNLGNTLYRRGQNDEALANYQKAIQSKSDYVEAYNDLGTIFRYKGHVDKAMACYKKAVQLSPNNPEYYKNLGHAFYQKGQCHQAISCFRKAVDIDPDYVMAYIALGSALKDQGQLNEAEQYVRHALLIQADSAPAYSNLLLYMNYNSRYTPQDIFSEHISFGKRFATNLHRNLSPHRNDQTLVRRLKIGYVSPDFKRHAVAYFIEPVLQAHDRACFEVFCYSDVLNHDQVTKRIQILADQWRDISNVGDKEVVELIHKDKIDILVDLAGHTANNRMLVFACNAAPIQISWIGYLATTGLPMMDYRIVDNYTDPFGETEQFYTETLIRMPENFICYLPDEDSPEVSPLPALSKNHITFGSFNNLAKIGPDVIELWVRILNAVSNSHLILKCKSFSDMTTCQNVMNIFTKRGIAAERIMLQSWDPSPKHLESYKLIDIGLDTFPFNGATTTCEALWMGVPVITLAGVAYHSRSGVSLLSNIGLSEFIATSPEAYLEIAVNLATDIGKLQLLRSTLRSMIINSPLTKSTQFTLNLEKCYRQMWKKWCEAD